MAKGNLSVIDEELNWNYERISLKGDPNHLDDSVNKTTTRAYIYRIKLPFIILNAKCQATCHRPAGAMSNITKFKPHKIRRVQLWKGLLLIRPLNDFKLLF
jgi:hypothetical protein